MDVIEEFDGRMTADTTQIYASASLKDLCPESRTGNCALVRCGVVITPCIDEEAFTDPSFNFETNAVCKNSDCITVIDEGLLEIALGNGLICSQTNLVNEF